MTISNEFRASREAPGRADFCQHSWSRDTLPDDVGVVITKIMMGSCNFRGLFRKVALSKSRSIGYLPVVTLFRACFNTGEYFQVTTRRASRINSSPV